jgi:hypothetical protein
VKSLLLLFLFAPSLLSAQSRFDGTWEMKMDTLVFSYNPLEYLLDQGMFHCMSCTPRVDVKADGSDQKVTGYPYDSLMVRVVSASSVEFIQKKNGSPTFACTEIVSPDGDTKTEEFSETPTTQRVTGKAVFKGRQGAGGFACALGIVANADRQKHCQHLTTHYLPVNQEWPKGVRRWRKLRGKLRWQGLSRARRFCPRDHFSATN